MSKKEKISAVEILARIKIGCIAILLILIAVIIIFGSIAFNKANKEFKKVASYWENYNNESTISSSTNSNSINDINSWWENNKNVIQE